MLLDAMMWDQEVLLRVEIESWRAGEGLVEVLGELMDYVWLSQEADVEREVS